MGRFFCISVLFLGITEGVWPHTIPKELWGTWVITREVPTTTISCWGEKEAKKLIGNALEYSTQLFRWRSTITKNPTAETKTISAQQFHDENSGGGANDSQVTFRQLGIKQDKVIQISIQHPAASIFGSTTEIPGDNVLLKGKNTIIFSVCNVYFEAERRVALTEADSSEIYDELRDILSPQ